jgi:Beta-propeller repeat
MNARLTLTYISFLVIAISLSTISQSSSVSILAAPAPETALPADSSVSPAQIRSQAPTTLSTSLAPVHAWAKTWGGTSETVANGMAIDTSGNIYVTGQFVGTTNFDPAGPNPSATFTSYNGTVDAYLAKFNAQGTFLWARTWGAGSTTCVPVSRGCGRDSAGSVVVDGAGNAYVGGLFQNTVDFGNGHSATSNAPNGSNNIYLTKFSADGSNQWVRAWGGKTGGEAYSVALDAAHGYVYIEGDWSTTPNTGSVDFNPGGSGGLRQNHGTYDAFLCKYALDGTFQWVQTWGGEGYDDGPGVAVDAAGNVYVNGMYGSTNINFDPNGGTGGQGYPATHSGMLYVDVFLSKFDANGNFQWVRTWGGDANGSGTTNAGGPIAIDSVGNVLIGGRFGCTTCAFNATGAAPGVLDPTVHSNGDLDAFIAKYDGGGNRLWIKTWGGTGWDAVVNMTTDVANNVYASTMFSTTVDFGGGPVTAKGLWDSGIVKSAADGTFQWAKTWGGSGQDFSGIAIDVRGNLYSAGNFQNTVDFGAGDAADTHVAHGSSDAFLSKFSNETQWYRVYVPLTVR